MAELPYTWTDRDGDFLVVGTEAISAHSPRAGSDTGVHAPTGADAVALARAVLAGGDTGHFVTSVDTALDSARVSVEHGARSMRERIIAEVVDILETHGTTDALLNDVKRLRVLPLLPDDTEEFDV